MQNDLQSLIIQNRLLTDEVKRRIDQLGAINAVAATVSQSLDLDKTLKTALEAVLNVVGAEAGGISLIDEKAGEVVLRAQQGWPDDFTNPPMRIPLGQGMSGKVISTNDIVVDNDFNETDVLAVPRFHDEKFRSIVMAPMHARTKIIGILSLMSNKPNSFNEELINVLRAVADTVGVAIDNARLYETTSEHEKQLNAVLQSTTDGMIATDQSGCISMINQAAQNLFDVDGRKLVGVPLRDAPIHAKIRESLLFALSSRTTENKTFQTTLETGRVISSIVSPVYIDSQVEKNGEHDGWVIVLRDISHLRESEIRRAEFMRAAAHDMKNPLGVALSAMHMLQDYYGNVDPTAKEIIRLALNGINRLQSLINDLLNLEQIESGLGINKAQFNLDELIREVFDDMKPIFVEKKMTYKLDISKDIPTIPGDRKWVKRAILNYVDNAAKYTNEGGEIKAHIFMVDELVHIEVIDNGPGIAVEFQPRLFERFYRATTDKIQGTGLGLAIVKSVAELHGGSVYVKSQPGNGSTFGMTVSVKGIES
ncbi:MAG: GAF domain-containing protein [Anaerolineaceae bacterium]|nr:GAF domain-containing protein [Anaerolineaceae bacterium]